MRDINLIPPDILSARRMSARLRLWIALNLGVAGMMALAVGAAFWSVRAERATAVQMDGRLAELGQRTEELERLRVERARLDEEEQALAFLLDREPDCDLIRSLAETIGDKGWLSRIELTRSVGLVGRKQTVGLLKMEGHAGSYLHLGDLMRELDALEWIGGVDLKRSQAAAAGGLEVIRFDLECRLSTGSDDSRPGGK